MKPNRIVITGAPGTGKSSLIKALELQGHHCLHEISRQVILKARNDGHEQLFLEKPLLFSELLLEGRVEQYHAATDFTGEFLFYDRGLLDVVAYLHYVDEKYPEEMQLVCNKHRYDKVFILPPWEAIYTPDNERYESFEEANKIHYYLESAYKSYNYDPIHVPIGTIEDRIAFIIGKITS